MGFCEVEWFIDKEFRMMSSEEKFAYLFTIQSILVKILHSILAPSLPVWVQEPSLCVLHCQKHHSWIISYPSLQEKGSMQCCCCSQCHGRLESIFVTIDLLASSGPSSYLLHLSIRADYFTHDAISSRLPPMSTDHQCLFQRPLISFTDGYKLMSYWVYEKMQMVLHFVITSHVTVQNVVAET